MLNVSNGTYKNSDYYTSVSQTIFPNYGVDTILLKHNNKPNLIPLHVTEFFFSRFNFIIDNNKFYSIELIYIFKNYSLKDKNV